MDREDVCTKSKENTTVELGILPITDSPVSTQHNIEVDQINHDDTPTMSNKYETISQYHIPIQPMGTSKESISSSEAVDSSMNSEEISTNDTEVSDSDNHHPPTRTMVTRSSMGIFKPNPKFALAIKASEVSIPNCQNRLYSTLNGKMPW